MTTFSWDQIRYDERGKVLLLYRHERIFTEGLIKRGNKVLDVGGWGVLLTRLLQEGCEAAILDLFTEDQRYAARVKALPHHTGDVCQDQLFPEGYWDAITCFETLEHCGDIPAALASMHKWLKPGGVLVGTVPVPGTTHHAADPRIHYVGAPTLVRMMKRVGFHNVSAHLSGSVQENDPVKCCVYFKGFK